MLFEKNTNREKLISAAAKTFVTISLNYSIWKITLLAGLDQCWHTQQCFDQIIRRKAEITKKKRFRCDNITTMHFESSQVFNN